MTEKRGGARKGAGRKLSETSKRIPVNIRLSEKAYGNLQKLSVNSGKSRQQLINEWAEGLFLIV